MNQSKEVLALLFGRKTDWLKYSQVNSGTRHRPFLIPYYLSLATPLHQAITPGPGSPLDGAASAFFHLSQNVKFLSHPPL